MAETENLPVPSPTTTITGFIGAAGGDVKRNTMAGALRQLAQSPDASWTYCSIPHDRLTGVAGAARLLRLTKGPCKQLKEIVNVEIQVANLIMHPGKFLEDGNGEVTGRMPRVLLIGPDDTVYSCGSWTVIEQLDMVINAGVTPPWEPPLNIIFHAITLGDGKTAYNMELVEKAGKGKR